MRIEAGVNVDDRNHRVAKDDHALDERRRGRDAGRFSGNHDLPDSHDVDEECLRTSAERDEAERTGGHPRTRNFRISSSRLRMASESSVSESLISPADFRFSSAIARTCLTVFMIVSLFVDWLAAAW